MVNEQNEPVGGAFIHVVYRNKTEGDPDGPQKCSTTPTKSTRTDVAGAFSVTGLTTEKVTLRMISYGYKQDIRGL